MNERTTHPVAPRTSALVRAAFACIAMVAAIVHVRAAQMRTAGLLDHDEAISLLAAAGKSQRAARLYDDQSADPPVERSAGSIRDLLRLTGDTGFADVTASLQAYDIHPPLYFWSLHAIQRAGVTSETCLRLFGSILLLVAALIFDRLVWPDSNRLLRVLAFAVLLLSPTLIATAVELRHYAMLLPGFALSWAAVMQLANPARRQGTTVVLIAIAPMLLMWSHLGSLVWLIIWAATLIVIGFRAGGRQRRAVVFGLSIAAASVAPLFIIYSQLLAARTSGSHSDAISVMAAIRDVLANSTAAFVTMPWRWQSGWATIVPFVLASVAAIWLARREGVADRLMLVAAATWIVAWIGLLAAGKLPPHATEPKYLIAATIGLFAVLVRGGSQIVSPGRLRVVLAVVACMLVSHAIALPSVLATPRDGALAGKLQGVRTVFVNDPKRGYLLPIAAELSADARLMIARPLRAPRDPATYEEPILVLEVRPLVGYPSSDAAERFRESLEEKHGQCEVLADGPRRRLTLYRGRRD